jgi:hypothetical protein
MKLKRRIGQRARDSERAQAWAKATNHDAIAATVVPENEPGDDHIIARADEGTRAQVRKLRVRALIQIVNFHHPDAGALIFAGENRGVSTGRQREQNRGFFRVGGREAGALDFGGVRRLLPVVVETKLHTVRVANFEVGILQCPGKGLAVRLDRRAEGAHNDPLRICPRDDKSTDQDVVTGQDAGAGRDVLQLRRRRWRSGCWRRCVQGLGRDSCGRGGASFSAHEHVGGCGPKSRFLVRYVTKRESGRALPQEDREVEWPTLGGSEVLLAIAALREGR